MQSKFLFIDRDGTILIEPEDKQIDSIDKFDLIPGSILALHALKEAGYRLVMISNQDGLGTKSFPQAAFDAPHQLLLKILCSQGIHFEDTLICPHFEEDKCDCRKPAVGLVIEYLNTQVINRQHSYVIGDRDSDLLLAKNMGITGIKLGTPATQSWQEVVNVILNKGRTATVVRKTKETEIEMSVDLDSQDKLLVNTGIGFFDHMLMQLASHGGFGLIANV
ncbi:MAG: histidinol-phosphatase, partial [Candidatus Berkiellales bacterium]